MNRYFCRILFDGQHHINDISAYLQHSKDAKNKSHRDQKGRREKVENVKLLFSHLDFHSSTRNAQTITDVLNDR